MVSEHFAVAVVVTDQNSDSRVEVDTMNLENTGSWFGSFVADIVGVAGDLGDRAEVVVVMLSAGVSQLILVLEVG